MFSKESLNVDADPGGPVQTTPLPTAYQNQRVALYAAPHGQAGQSVAQHKAQIHKHGVAGLTHHIQWVLLSLLRQFPHAAISNPRQQHTGTYEIHSVGEHEQAREMLASDSATPSILSGGESEPSLVNQQFGDYTLIRLLGQGGYASVFLALQRFLQTPVALKLLSPWLASDLEVQRFHSEARLLAHLRHPHIVRALDFGWQDNLPFLVMEYAPGGTLHDYFPPQQPLPLGAILLVVSQAASALQYVHHHGLIHCDVKPGNLLLGPRQQVWLSDFGTAATAVSLKQISENEFVGTPTYLAPERINDYPLPASDQYALAVMVYRWLCGRGPFEGTMLQVCRQHVETPPPRMRDFVSSVSPDVEQVVLRALAKDPLRRFAHVQEFAYALKRASRALHLAAS